MAEAITTIWAFVAVDRDSGKEAVVGMRSLDGTYTPLVSADRDQIESLKMIARRIARESGREVKLIKFTNREEVAP